MAVVTRIGFLLLLPLAAWAGSSANYTINPTAFDGGGALASSAAYTVNPSTAPGAAGSSTNYTLRSGYAGQLFERVSIHIEKPSSAITINESATLQLEVSEIYDDASRAILAANDLVWSAASGTIESIDPSGLLTAGSVYQDTATTVRASSGGMFDELALTVANTGSDDFAAYANDGLPDTWQVQYFGESSTRGGSSMDFDNDGVVNLLEFAYGTDPSQALGGSVQWSGSSLITAGSPIPYVFQGGMGTYSYRAAFSRRKDYSLHSLTYTVEFSADLNTWEPSSVAPTILADDGIMQAVYVPYLDFVNGKRATFFRVGVQNQ
jgi:hypothetical protein